MAGKFFHSLNQFLSHIIPGCWGAGSYLGHIINGEGPCSLRSHRAMPTEGLHEYAGKDLGEFLQPSWKPNFARPLL